MNAYGLFLVCLLFVIVDPTKSLRMKRQGWNWEDVSFEETTARPTRPPPTQAPSMAAPEVTTTKPPADFTRCMNACLTTPQWNPVCGNDRVTYMNAGRLQCARKCGQHNLELVHIGQCSP